LSAAHCIANRILQLAQQSSGLIKLDRGHKTKGVFP
jgi:hypothetical protein